MGGGLRRGRQWVGVFASVAALCGCGGGSGPADGGLPDGSVPHDTGVSSMPVMLNPSAYTYTLLEGTPSVPLWTTPATRKLTPTDRPPSATASGITLRAARNEFEPAQIVLGPAGGSATVQIAPFADLPAGQRVSLARVGYETGFAEHLLPLSQGAAVALDPNAGTPVWITVYVPPGSAPGAHHTTLTITPGGGSPITVPVTLEVFDFDLPRDIHFDSQFNLGISQLIPSGGSVDDAKTLLFEHRMTPTAPTWPSGLSYNITWDSDANPMRCSGFWDEPTEQPQYSIGSLSKRYILGQGWNGVGFPSDMVLTFVDNDTPRPDAFCGVSRGADAFGTASYNAAWSQYLTALQNYLVANGFASRAYYYVQNEPQDDSDYQIAAALCRLTRAAAPQLRIAISEEPKPEIAERSDGACGYDIWIAHVRAYQQTYAQTRQRDHGEQVWFYSLDQDPPPYFNPTRVDTPGLHERIIPWVSWHYRATGWAYYDAGRFFDGAQPTVRAELFREGFEDYEYLYLANGGARPSVGTAAIPDPSVDSAASGLNSFTDDPDAFMALRDELGRFVEGSRATVPTLSTGPSARPRGEYHLNFQDPRGMPAADPLVVGGKTYLKIGWQPYDAALHYGWTGEFINDPTIALYGYDDVSGFSEVQKSYVYDDYGRDNLFEFDLENGRYSVTVSVGRPAHGYPTDPHNLTLEGMPVVNDEITTDAMPTITRTVTIDLADGKLSFVVGGRSQSTGDFAYTFLESIDIVPVN